MESAPLAALAFAGNRTGDEIAGTVRRGASEGHFRLIRIAEVDVARRAALFGDYEMETGRVIWVGPFGEFGADQYVLDVASGRFAALYPRSETTFVAGPAILTPLFPLAMTLTVQTNDRGQATGLLFQEGDAAPVRAVRRERLRDDVTPRQRPL